MRSARIIKHAEIMKLQSVDEIKEKLEAEYKARFEALEAERAKILEDELNRILHDSMTKATKIIVDAEVAAAKQLNSIEPTVAKLVAETVSEIIGSMDRDEAVTRATTQALLKLSNHRRGHISVAADIASAVRVAVSEAGDQGAEIVEIEVDDRLENGRAILSSDNGFVEIGLGAQLASMREAWGIAETGGETR